MSLPEHVFVPAELGRASRQQSFRPTRDFAVAEAIDPGPGRAIFHSARWPVLNRRSWVVDFDDFGYPVMWGRSAIDPRQRRRFARGRPELVQRTMLERSARMLAAYTHPSCKAILFLTEQGVAEAYQWLRAVAGAGVRRAFLERCHVAPAAHRALDGNEVRRKWREDPTTVVFCGRDYYQKNGRLALDVMTSMASRFPEARFHYVGATPDSSLARGFGALPNATLHGPLPRAKALAVIAASHVLIHPARYESFGMVYAEAMAAGLAIISSAGPQMEHVDELIGSAGALFVRRSGDFGRDRAGFSGKLQQLLEHRNDATAMGAANYRCATSGTLSLRRRNGLLEKIYQRAEDEPAEPLSIEALVRDSTGFVRLSAHEVVEDFRQFRRSSPRAPMSVLLTPPATIARLRAGAR